MLGYDVDFGHMEAVSLISAPKYPEKQVNYFPFITPFYNDVLQFCVCLSSELSFKFIYMFT